MLNLDIPQILRSLAQRRPVFHSEADFRLELALYLREKYPHLYPVCEYPLHRASKQSYDIMLLHGREEVMALELKYFCQALIGKVQGEPFHLKWNGAADGGRYATLKDVGRLERFRKENPTARADVIVVSNDSNFWEGPKRENTNDAAFSIKCGRKGVTGMLKWAEKSKVGKRKGYEAFRLRRRYDLLWQDYSHIEEQEYGLFRFLHIEVQRLPA